MQPAMRWRWWSADADNVIGYRPAGCTLQPAAWIRGATSDTADRLDRTPTVTLTVVLTQWVNTQEMALEGQSTCARTALRQKHARPSKALEGDITGSGRHPGVSGKPGTGPGEARKLLKGLKRLGFATCCSTCHQWNSHRIACGAL
jgi:hypothetical protein